MNTVLCERLQQHRAAEVDAARRRLATPEQSYPKIDFTRARIDVSVDLPDDSRKKVPDYLQHVIDAALTNDQAAVALDRAFSQMNDFRPFAGERVRLGYDWAPFSFSFAFSGLHGGLIYDGPGLGDWGAIASDGGMPSLTVSLSPSRGEHRWSMHT